MAIKPRTVLTVIGARPQFIKAAVVSPVLRQSAREVLVHTGQHYDAALSGNFFHELKMPKPDYELAVGSASHAVQTARMLLALEPVMSREHPDVVVVYGDTNSTLAGALTAAQKGIPVAHVEAGLRSFNRAMPEEINRVMTDHLAARLYCPTPSAVANLAREGITRGVRLTGDVMDVAVRMMVRDADVPGRYQVRPGGYAVATVHRQENTDDRTRLAAILQGLGSLPWPVLLPLHPRTRRRMAEWGLAAGDAVRLLDPLGYGDMLSLAGAAGAVLTDSGGLQREACALGVPTYVLRDETEWVELVQEGRAVLVGAQAERIRSAVTAGTARPRVESLDRDPVGLMVADLVQE